MTLVYWWLAGDKEHALIQTATVLIIIASYYEKLRANGSSICALASKSGDNPAIRAFDIG
jgi:hypothetical protein